MSWTTLRSQLREVLHLQEPPHRTALAFAIGVFIAFAPHYGFHTLSAFLCAWLFRLNYLAIFLGTFLNNPWTIVPILAATMSTGFAILGLPQAAPLDWDHIEMDHLFEAIRPYLMPFIVGGCVLGSLGALIAYPTMLVLIHRYQALRTNK
ncbi:MAG: DUF2062 domain-containing protein [Nitrospirae bacterium]|nr:MAG: DUF2062 domain-containing protein [Nitrospirota bacterium]